MDLSIIIPVYNGEKYIKECLDSVFDNINKLLKIEVIIIDDGSNDNSKYVYNNYQKDNVRIIKNENRGVSFSRNIGIEIANGKYIMFLDCDDLLDKNWEKNIYDVIEKDYDIIYFSKSFQKSDYDKKDIIENILRISTSMNIISIPCSKIFKKQFLKNNNIFFDEAVINGEDMLFNIKAIIRTDNYICIDKCIYWYRIRYDSSTKKFNEKFFDSDKIFHDTLNKILCESRLNVTRYSSFYLKNAILLSIYKISLSEFPKKYFKIFHEEPYREFIENYKISNIFNRKDIIMFLIKKEKYNTAILLTRIKTKIKKINTLKGKTYKFMEV